MHSSLSLCFNTIFADSLVCFVCVSFVCNIHSMWQDIKWKMYVYNVHPAFRSISIDYSRKVIYVAFTYMELLDIYLRDRLYAIGSIAAMFLSMLTKFTDRLCRSAQCKLLDCYCCFSAIFLAVIADACFSWWRSILSGCPSCRSRFYPHFPVPMRAS